MDALFVWRAEVVGGLVNRRALYRARFISEHPSLHLTKYKAMFHSVVTLFENQKL